MRKRLLSILLLCCMVLTLLPTAAFATGDTVGPVEKADGPAAPVIELVTRTHTDIKVTENDKWEYSIDNGATWQGSCHFTNLQPGTEYTIIARVKETATHKPSGNSAPLNVTTIHLAISDELSVKLRAVVSAYKAEYDGKEHKAVIVDDTNMPEGWSIAGHTAGTGDDFVPQIPKIRNVSGSNLTVKTKFTHPDYGQSLIVYSYPEITPKPMTAGMIADIPPQLYTGQSIHPTPEIKDGNTPLVKDKDFTYSYDTNTSPEQGGKVTINGKDNYKDTAFKTFTIVSTITEDDLAGLNIPANLVTVKCQTTGDSKAYGRIAGGFDLSNSTPYMENGVWKAIVKLNLPAYRDKYGADTKKPHEDAGLEGNTHAAFTLKYVNNKWELDGTFPNVVILVKCDGQHPQTPRYTITFNGNGGTPSVTSMTTIDQKLPELPTATHSGSYSFDGWYTAASGGTKITTAYVFSANTTVYAHWTYTGGGGWYYTYYTIKATAGTNGSISPSGWTSVRDGWDQTFTITPDKGYAVAKVLVDGKSVGSVKSYTFKNVTKDHTIEAIFMKSNGNPATGVFVDVAEGSYYEEAVDWAVENGITTGTGNNYFTPDGICTRVQAVTFLRRAMAE